MAQKESWLSSFAIILLQSISNDSHFLPFSAVTGSEILLSQILSVTINKPFFYKKSTKADVRNVQQWPSKSHSSNKPNIPDKLWTCSKIWIRIDHVRKPLKASYSGSYKVLRRSTKCFLVVINRHNTHIFIDRLKSCMKLSAENKIPNPKTPTKFDAPKYNNYSGTVDTKQQQKSSAGKKIMWKKDYYYYWSTAHHLGKGVL